MKLWITLCALLLSSAVWVRGRNPAPPRAPQDREGVQLTITEPLQLLGSGAHLRVRELDLHVDPRRQVTWRALRGRVFAISGCPSLKAWLEGEEGQRVEQLLTRLRAGGSEDALAALSLVFQLARATQWEAGLLGGAASAEKLAELLQDWLRVWAQPAADDPLLHEPALAATLLYARAMRTAYSAPVVGRSKGPYERARRFLFELCGTGTRQHTDFGRALEARYPRALRVLEQENDCLAALSAEARTEYPDLDGACGR